MELRVASTDPTAGTAVATRGTIESFAERIRGGERPLATFRLGDETFGTGEITSARVRELEDGHADLLLTLRSVETS